MTKKPSLRGPREWRIPDGDDKKRLTCPDCDHITYSNPKPIVGTMVTYGDKILLCRRAIPPRTGFWTIPGGYMEEGESLEDGAKRETREESGAQIEIDALLAIYDIPHAGQIHMLYRGQMTSPAYQAGPESLEVKLFDWDDIPWSDLAFPITAEILRQYHRTKDQITVMPARKTIPPMPAPGKPPAP